MINHVTPIIDVMILLVIRQITKRCIYLLLVSVCSLIIYILSISLKLLLLLCNLKYYFEHINCLNTFVGFILKYSNYTNVLIFYCTDCVDVCISLSYAPTLDWPVGLTIFRGELSAIIPLPLDATTPRPLPRVG